MNLFGHDIAFWFAAIGAAVLKIALSPWNGITMGLISFAAGIFCAIVFSDPVISYLNLDRNIYGTATTAIVVMTGEGVVRWLLYIVAKPSRITEFMKSWRGGK